MNKSLRFAFIVGLIILVFLVSNSELFAFDEEQLRTASLVTKYQDGYLVSIIVKGANIDKTGLEKYEIILPGNNQKIIYKAVDVSDYPLVESKYRFSLKNKIIFFGSWHRDNFIAKGESYYVKFNELGAGNFIEDVMVFVKGTKELNDILPVWAKKYSVDDETFKWQELRGRKIFNHEFANTTLLENMHKIIKSRIDQEGIKNGFTQSIYSLSNEFKEDAYLIELRPEAEQTYLLIVNGASLIANVKYSVVLILDEQLRITSELVPLAIDKSEKDYFTNYYKLEHIYHSDKLNRDLIIGAHNRGLGYRVFLIYQGKVKIVNLPIFTQYGD